MEKLETEFAQIVKEQKDTIYTVCYMFSKDAEEINDLFQEILVNLWKGFSSFRGQSHIKTWVWKVSLNTCISFDRKKRSRAQTIPLKMNINLYKDNDKDSLQIRMLYERVNRLGLFDRAIILLWLENLSYEEIGAIVGISAKNVSVRLYRIKEELKKCLISKTIFIMEKYITSFELEEMKQQICLLKEKLEKQTIINDNMIRQAMQQKVSRMHKDAIIMIIVAIIGIPYCFFFFMLVGFSYWLAAGTVLFLLACLVKLNQNKKKLSRIRTLLNENLVECGKSILLLKKRHFSLLKL